MFSPIDLRLHPSWVLAAALALPALAALSLLLSCSAPLWLKWLSLLAIVGLTGWVIRRDALLLQSASVLHLQLNHRIDPRSCQLHLRCGERLQARILAGSIVLASLALLKIKPLSGGRCRVLLICRFNAEAQAFRRLRVVLRLHAPPPETPLAMN